MPTRGFVTIQDFNGEVSTAQFWVQDIGAGNYASVTQDIDEIKDAMLTVIEGNVIQTGFTKTFPENPAAVTVPSAQRERKWLVTYRDTTQFLDAGNTIANPGYLKIFNVEVATADLSHLLPNSDEMDINDGGAGEAFATTMSANLRSPYNFSAVAPTVEVLRVVHVGRNS